MAATEGAFNMPFDLTHVHLRSDVNCASITEETTAKYNLFFLYNKNSNGLLKILRAWKKTKTSLAVCRRDLTWFWRHPYICPPIDRGQQPIKMHTKVRLLYKKYYIICTVPCAHFKSILVPSISCSTQCLTLPDKTTIDCWVNISQGPTHSPLWPI